MGGPDPRGSRAILRNDMWVMGPYGMMQKESGPPAAPMRVAEDDIRQSRPVAVVGRYTSRYQEQGMQTSGAYVTTSGREGVAQAAESVQQATGGQGLASKEVVVLSVDIGGAEAQMKRNAMEATGRKCS